MLKKLIDRLTLIFFVITEILLIYLSLDVIAPTLMQRGKNYAYYKMCPYGVKSYDYRIVSSDDLAKYELIDVIKELNYKVGFQLFTYKESSNNRLIIEPEIKDATSSAVIGQTSCVSVCCGINDFDIQYKERYLYDPLEAKIIIWHELGHAVGLQHDDSKAAIMNTIVLKTEYYNDQIEQDYINSLKKRMNIK